jgi:hypothetical protein
MILSACAQVEPTSLQPSISPLASEMAAESMPPGAADVLIAVDEEQIAYAVKGCPITAWLDETIEDDINFGAFPEYLTVDDGTRWSTHMVVLRIVNADVTDWSFVLTTPLTGRPGDAERRLISRW